MSQENNSNDNNSSVPENLHLDWSIQDSSIPESILLNWSIQDNTPREIVDLTTNNQHDDIGLLYELTDNNYNLFLDNDEKFEVPSIFFSPSRNFQNMTRKEIEERMPHMQTNRFDMYQKFIISRSLKDMLDVSFFYIDQITPKHIYVANLTLGFVPITQHPLAFLTDRCINQIDSGDVRRLREAFKLTPVALLRTMEVLSITQAKTDAAWNYAHFVLSRGGYAFAKHTKANQRVITQKPVSQTLRVLDNFLKSEYSKTVNAIHVMVSWSEFLKTEISNFQGSNLVHVYKFCARHLCDGFMPRILYFNDSRRFRQQEDNVHDEDFQNFKHFATVDEILLREQLSVNICYSMLRHDPAFVYTVYPDISIPRREPKTHRVTKKRAKLTPKRRM